MTVDGATQNLTTTTLGWRSEIDLPMPGGGGDFSNGIRSIKLHSSIGWRHEFGDVDPSTQVTFVGANPFTVTGSPLDEDSLVTGLTISAELRDNLILSASHQGHLSENSQVHNFSIGLTARF